MRERKRRKQAGLMRQRKGQSGSASLLWSHSAAATLQLAACGLYNNNTSSVCGGVVMLRALCNARLTENLMSKNVEKYFGRFISPYD